MRIRFILFAVYLLALSIPLSAQTIRILDVGTFHGEEVTANNGELWLGLYQRENSDLLLPSILSVENVYDLVLDSEDAMSGKQITVPGMGQPLFLLKGKGFDQARPVKTITKLNGEIGGDFDEYFEFNGQEFRLRVESDHPQEEGFIGNNSKLIFSSGKYDQVLYEVGDCSFCKWKINWAGDLDSDGKPDFYLYLTNHYNVANQKLFLSSTAESDKLLKEVAELTITGC